MSAFDILTIGFAGKPLDIWAMCVIIYKDKTFYAQIENTDVHV